MIGVVYIDSGWILQHIALKMCEADERFIPIPRGSLNQVSDIPKNVKALYYVDVQNCWNIAFKDARPDIAHVGMFTHLDGDDSSSFRSGWDRLEAVVHMATRYEKAFSKWYKPYQMTTIVPGEVSGFPNPKEKIGICQRGGHIGKGKDFLPLVIDSLPTYVRDNIELHFCGDGWGVEPPDFMGPYIQGTRATQETYCGVDAVGWHEQEFTQLYQNIDTLLIPSMWEGGPMSLLEALATKKSVIAANVGFVPDFFEAHGYGEDHTLFQMYTAGSVTSCAKAINDLITPKVMMRSVVENLSYKSYAQQVYDFITSFRIVRDES